MTRSDLNDMIQHLDHLFSLIKKNERLSIVLRIRTAGVLDSFFWSAFLAMQKGDTKIVRYHLVAALNYIDANNEQLFPGL